MDKRATVSREVSMANVEQNPYNASQSFGATTFALPMKYDVVSPDDYHIIATCYDAAVLEK